MVSQHQKWCNILISFSVSYRVNSRDGEAYSKIFLYYRNVKKLILFEIQDVKILIYLLYSLTLAIDVKYFKSRVSLDLILLSILSLN